MGRSPMSCCAIREGQFIGNGFTSGVPRRREYELIGIWLGSLHKVMMHEKNDDCGGVLI